MPILVGGTHYYLQSLLWSRPVIEGDIAEQDYNDNYESLDTAELYRKLQEVDPLMALRWHPNERRKILRSLRVSLVYFTHYIGF